MHYELLRLYFCCLCIAGQPQVYLADPSAVEKVFQNEEKYPLRSLMNKNADWITKRRKEPSPFAFQ